MRASIACSIGVCVYNEEKNIRKLLTSLTRQTLLTVEISEIIVVASAPTDKTCDIVEEFAAHDRRIRLVKQPRREGKSSAVNLFIQTAREDVLVLMGGDLILDASVVQRLVQEFSDAEVGMAGARPVPVNNIDAGFCGFAAHLLWDLHHRLSLVDPKMGEVIAFRKVFRRIPVMSSVDEANIEPLIRGQGYRIRYVPEARVMNKDPETVSDFIKQRRRIYSGHLAVKHEQSYSVATMNIFSIGRMLLAFLRDNPRPRYLAYAPAVIALEGYSRLLGWWDYHVAKKRHTVWETVESTKNLEI